LSAPANVAGERRYLAVMFCDHARKNDGAKVFQCGQILWDLRGRFWSELENQLSILSAQVASFDVLPLNYSPFCNVLKYSHLGLTAGSPTT
jgi:hypothetical protein